jgi:DNA-binding transcriptional LysR family regulator
MRRTRPRNGGSISASERESENIFDSTDRRNIPTDLLRTFVAIYELGSFTKAAHMFELTQPAISAHMRRLESIIGADLIEKNISGVNLTTRGAEILRYAQRMLSINDQIVSYGARRSSLQVIRLGIPNLFAPTKLRRIVNECRDKVGSSRLQICCDHSTGLLRSISNGYLDLAFTLGDDDEMKNALASWANPLVWVRSPDFRLDPGRPVPLVSSPNLLVPDRMAMEALEQANQRYEIAFTAFDMMARRSAVAAGLGYMTVMTSLVPDDLVVEQPGALPQLPSITTGILTREDLDTTELKPLIYALEAIFAPSQ